jgi:hypothetical protein
MGPQECRMLTDHSDETNASSGLFARPWNMIRNITLSVDANSAVAFLDVFLASRHATFSALYPLEGSIIAWSYVYSTHVRESLDICIDAAVTCSFATTRLLTVALVHRTPVPLRHTVKRNVSIACINICIYDTSKSEPIEMFSFLTVHELS